YLRAMPAVPAHRPCSVIVREYAREVIQSWGGPPRTRVVRKEAAQDKVDFELARTDPKPYGELILTRVLCQQGTLAVASCAGPVPEEQDLRPICNVVLQSLEIYAASHSAQARR